MTSPTAIMQTLAAISARWSTRHRPAGWPVAVPLKRLPPPSYHGDNPYNGFTGAERRRGDQVLIVLRKQGVIAQPDCCDICGTTKMVGFHGEDYFDSFSLAVLCFPCHMALHRRFRYPRSWLERLAGNPDSPLIADYRALPMQEVDFAGWLRQNTSGPFDMARRIWPEGDIPDYAPRARSKPDYLAAVQTAAPTKSELAALHALLEAPGATAAELSARIGARGPAAWHLVFGRFCKRLETTLGPAPRTDARKDNQGRPAPFYIGLLAHYDDATHGFTLKEAGVSALRGKIL